MLLQDGFFLSDLEQTKGFEFDSVVVVNCSQGVLPHPGLPAEESFRDLCRLYVAMTRAKTQLVVSFSKARSPFLEAAKDAFVEARFSDYADRTTTHDFVLPEQIVPALLDPEAWARSAPGFLKSRDAVGLDRVVQQELLEHVTGEIRLRGRERKALEWRTFGAFVKAMEEPRARHQIISDEAWTTLFGHVQYLRRLSQHAEGQPGTLSLRENRLPLSN